MDPESESELDIIGVSTADRTESHPSLAAIFPQAWQPGGLTRDAKLVRPFGFSPSFLGARVIEDRTSGTSRSHTPKYSETMGMHAAGRQITNYNYYISGGVGGRGGDARDQGTGGGGGAGHGPILYFGETSQETLSPFRTIRLGDLDLLKELRLDGQSSVADRSSRGAGVRRMYHANLVVRQSERKVTVAMYQGDGAEEEWRRDTATYESIRHPNFLQLYGLVNTKKLCAMVFHSGDIVIELIPCDQFLRRFEHSPILTIYIMGYCATEFYEAANYHDSIFPMARLNNLYPDVPLWIRPATGQLCIDLSPGQERDLNLLFDTQNSILRFEKISLDDPKAEALVISSLDEYKYYELCSKGPIARRWRHPNILQLYGLVNTKKLCAIIFHDELIPYTQFRRRFEHSQILTAYIWGYCRTEWNEAVNYYASIFRKSVLAVDYDELTLWIRPATGQLCVDLTRGQEQDNTLFDTAPQDSILRLENISLDDPTAEVLSSNSSVAEEVFDLSATADFALVHAVPVGLQTEDLAHDHETS
ncbi:hypothetical protein MSAN_02272500 [Mycena sanguinolenta]|uniref:Protein kinase domain-containing protein n=1 Tax=Mycena sanguinolenta TaxID=230812 RepID=A0A8H6XA16_9AGAR|nr:hypothetical protein MSAN_02272500 [Mycena sanguinolenta]